MSETLAQGKVAVLCTLIWKEGSGPREPGAKMLITQEGKATGTIGGGGMERLLINKALEVIEDGRPRTYHFAMGVPAREGMIPVDSKCGGEVKIFMDLVKPDPRLVIMGSGWIAQAVARYAKECNFEVIVIDDAETAKQEHFPDMTVINDKYPESLKQVEIRPSDYVAMLHGETSFELAGLRYAVNANPAYIGLLGSGNKAKEHKKQLKKEGYDSENVDAIKGPIGLDISAETPEEIGVSIVAELIQQKRG
ncbi:MAG: XdhC family protein [Candidatus Bathyarchaeota archaeon]|nr:XdhC family protein [Candidatus Bathyarchaeota archaeon]